MIKLYHFDELKPEEILNRDIRAEKNVEDVVDDIIADVRRFPPNLSRGNRYHSSSTESCAHGLSIQS